MDWKELGIYKVRLPLPFRLNHINCYGVKGKDGWYIIDTGLDIPAGREGWNDFFREQEVEFSGIKGIFLTHFHPDHFGLSGWLQMRSKAPVYIGRGEKRFIEWYGRIAQTGDAIREMFSKHGMPADILEQVVGNMMQLARHTEITPEFTFVEPDSVHTIGDYEFMAIETPGHACGHVCYYNKEHGILFAGDHLLAKISSNISFWPGLAANPLADYLNSLEKIRRFPCSAILSAHGPQLLDMGERIDELTEFHARRLDETCRLTEGGARAWEICQQLFGTGLNLHEIRFAMCEALAHLVYLVDKERVSVCEKGGTVLFYSA